MWLAVTNVQAARRASRSHHAEMPQNPSWNFQDSAEGPAGTRHSPLPAPPGTHPFQPHPIADLPPAQSGTDGDWLPASVSGANGQTVHLHRFEIAAVRPFQLRRLTACQPTRPHCVLARYGASCHVLMLKHGRGCKSGPAASQRRRDRGPPPFCQTSGWGWEVLPS